MPVQSEQYSIITPAAETVDIDVMKTSPLLRLDWNSDHKYFMFEEGSVVRFILWWETKAKPIIANTKPRNQEQVQPHVNNPKKKKKLSKWKLS